MTENTAVRVIFSVLAASPPSPMAGGIASPCPCLAFEVFGVPLDAFAALAAFGVPRALCPHVVFRST